MTTPPPRRWSAPADAETRIELLDFFRQLPLILRRDDVRIVHACWQPEMVAMVSGVDDVVEYYRQHRYNIDLGLALRADLEPWQREQRHQNLNPVKVLTSGLEVQASRPSSGNGKSRLLERYPWWQDYQEEAICFFGHYNQPYGVSRNQSRAVCVDYGVSRRWKPKQAGDNSPKKWRLAAIRYPEWKVVFDDGVAESLNGGTL